MPSPTTASLATARRPAWLPEAEPWPVVAFADTAALPPALRPAVPRAEVPSTESPRDWVPDFRQEVLGVKHGGSGYDDDADGLTIGLRWMRARLQPEPESGATEPAGNRFLPRGRAGTRVQRTRAMPKRR